MKNFLLLATFSFLFISCLNSPKNTEWVSLFDGKSLDGWAANENPETFFIEDNAIVCNGNRSHLFYTGTLNNAEFKNFEFVADIMTMPNANSGIYIHTKFQKEGWPSKGYEVQVNNSFLGNPEYPERKKTAGLYGIRNKYLTTVGDNEWFTMHIKVMGNRIQVFVNDQIITDYTEPENAYRSEDFKDRLLDKGTFALQGHDPESKVFYKNIMVKVLPDDATFSIPQEQLDPETEREITRLHTMGFPIVDLHVHLKGGLTMEEALSQSRYKGIDYGIAVNCGKADDFPVNNDEELLEYIKTVQNVPAFNAMQAEGREWVDIFSIEAIKTFDYVFTDAMTFRDANGIPAQMWKPDHVKRLDFSDHEKFMDELVDYLVVILNEEPIDLYVNSTYLPDTIASEYDKLWTEERMKKVIQATIDNQVAIEISCRLKLPSFNFISLAKEMGAKFTFGTNNIDGTLGHLEYGLQAIKECNLVATDIWLPGY